MILHWKGTSWSRVTGPNPGTYDQLHAVTATSASNVWAAGYFFKANSATCGPLFAHWNGSAWSEVPSKFDTTCDNIFGIDAVAATDIWAVGYDATTGMGTLILHWNGTAWAKVSSPSPGKTYNILTGVSAVSAKNAWAAGYYCKSHCTSGIPVYAALILHWNGTAWSKAAVPASTGSQLLNGVEAISARDAWAVGYTQKGFRSLILHWNGRSWSTFTSPNVGPLTQTAFGSAASGWAFGTFDLRWNGTRWSRVTLPAPAVGVLAASAAGTKDVWAVGSYCAGKGCTRSPAIYNSLTMHWNGRSWSRR